MGQGVEEDVLESFSHSTRTPDVIGFSKSRTFLALAAILTVSQLVSEGTSESQV